MDKLIFDTGIKEYEVNGKAILRFNPTDQNVYARFCEFYNEIVDLIKPYDEAVEKFQKENQGAGIELDEKGFAKAAQLMEVSRKTDINIKERLTYVFGDENDFEAMFGGVNIAAATDSGDTVIENFLEAILPLVETNAENREKMMKEKIEKATSKANLNRQQRRKIANGKLDSTDNS